MAVSNQKEVEVLPVSSKAGQFTESVIREMSRLAAQHGAVNLAQGFPDFPAPEAVKSAATDAVARDINQYAITWGSQSLRSAISAKAKWHLGVDVDPGTEVTVVCGATEGMLVALLAVVDPGDEVVVFEPFYENYGPDAILAGAVPRYVPLEPPHWQVDPAALAAAFSPRTRAVILNSPHNPTGKVFSTEEIGLIGAACLRHGAYLITDEIYEHILYAGTHVSPLQMPELRPQSIVVNSMSKTYSVTGWRVGWVIAAPSVTGAIRKVHDFVTVGAPAPLQEAGAAALALPRTYYTELARDYRARRDRLLEALAPLPLAIYPPDGAYYVLVDFGTLPFADDLAFARYLVRDVGVAVVPGSSFYSAGSDRGRSLVRLCFCKADSTLDEARRRLAAANWQ